MRFSARRLSAYLTICLSTLCANHRVLAQGITTSANPSVAENPITITGTFCSGPKTFAISFYYGTVAGVTPSSLIGTVTKPAGGYASVTWTPPAAGTYYLYAVPTPSEPAYCPNPSGIFTQTVKTASTLFGFYDTSSPGFPDETQAVSSFANTSWIGCVNPAECDARLQEAKYFNMRAVVAFNDPALPPPGSSAATVQNWTTAWNSNWANYVAVFTPYVADGTIAAFYPYDEPIGGEWSSGNNASTTTSYLNTVAATIKQTFPSAKVAMVFTGADTFTYLVHGQNVIPSGYDWIGIDIYGCYSSCSDSDNTLTEGYSWYLTTLENNLYSGQKVILLPGTAIYYSQSYSQLTQSFWLPWLTSNVANVKDILNLAASDAHVVGAFGFLYQNYYPGGSFTAPGVWVGADDPQDDGEMIGATTEYGQQVFGRTFTPPSNPPNTIVAGQPVELVSVNSGKCLDVQGQGTTPGTLIQQFDCLGSKQLNQMWKLYKVSTGEYQIMSQYNYFQPTPMCLDLQGGGTANGTPVQQWNCSAAGTNRNQLWSLVPSGSGYEIVSAASGNCLDVTGVSMNDGALIQTWQCLGAGQVNQIWTLAAPH